MSRHQDALDIQKGACNPIAIANVLVKAITEARSENQGTDSIRQDPAVRLICHQLAFLLNIAELDNSHTAYLEAEDACKRHVEGGQQ